MGASGESGQAKSEGGSGSGDGSGVANGNGNGGRSGNESGGRSDSGPMDPFDLSVEFNLVTLVDDILASVKNVQVW